MSLDDRLQFPDTLIVQFNDEDRPISSIAIMLTFYATRKNGYYFVPQLSDASGIINVTREWVERSIEETRNFFIMDYSSRLGDCYAYMDVEVMTDAEIRRGIEAGKNYGLKPGELGVEPSDSDLLNASNSQYEPQFIRVEMRTAEKIKRLEIKLKKEQKPLEHENHERTRKPRK